MELKNKVIILTGAARIGVDVAKALSEQGAKLAVSYFTTEPTVGDFKFKADLSNETDVLKFVAETKKHFGQIDGLVHMAATYERVAWKDLNDDAWRRSMKAIAKSAFLMGKAVGDVMLEQKTEGRMVFISDWSVATQPYKDYVTYNIAKAAVEGLTRSLAKELAPNILVNCIAPGPMLKPADLSETDNAEVLKNTPLARWGGAEEISKAVLYLLDSNFTTGQILYVDGGRSIT